VGFTICTHIGYRLSQDLTLDKGKLPKNRKNTGEKREEPFRRATEEDPSPRMNRTIDVMCTE